MDRFVSQSRAGWTEVRVHGVSGTPPQSELDHPTVELVAGDRLAGFYWRVWDRQLLDPASFAKRPGDPCYEPLKGHSGYFADPAFDQCVHAWVKAPEQEGRTARRGAATPAAPRPRMIPVGLRRRRTSPGPGPAAGPRSAR
ncbi:hypothetical protein ABZ733_15485 [Streptomyces longwoodensis]|uniref:hypothetical protein n=1 Tax=Streptomyces longwoodensis TaxID=68231 RepID=UPI0033CFAC37